MKNIITKLLVLFAFILFAPNVFASVLTEDLTLESDSEECYIVESGSDITINLNNHNITCTNKDAIYVENGAKLKVEGNGVVQSVTSGKAALFNNGNVILNGGTFTADNQKTGYYSVLNHGLMTINEGVTVSQTNYKTSSLFDNGYYAYTSTDERLGFVEGKGIENPTLTINGGLFDGGMNTIKNDDGSILTINDGHFINNVQVAVMNWNIATINGGLFEVPTGDDKTTVFVGSYGKDSDDKGILTINGGRFNANHILEFQNGRVSDVNITITGGTFNSLVSFVNESGRPKWSNVGTKSITGGVFTDTTIVPDEGYSLIPIDQDNNEDGVNDVLVTKVQLVPAVDVSLKVDGTYNTNLDSDINNYGTWTSSDTEVATVNKGIITAHKKGTATIKVKFGSDTRKFNVTVTRIQVNKPTVSGKYTYNGEEQEVVLNGFNEEIMTVNNNTGLEVNDYVTTVSLKNTVKYEWNDGTSDSLDLEWKINKASVSVPTLKKINYPYTGEMITPEIEGFDEDAMNITGDVSKTEMGNYNITITLKDSNSYEWASEEDEVVLEWSITKGKLTKPTLNPQTYNYTGEEVRPTLKNYDENLMELGGIIVGAPVGKYTLRVSIKDKDKYTWSDGTSDDLELVWTITFGVPEVKAKSDYNSVKLSWSAVEGAAGYQVYRCNSKGSSCKKLVTTEELKYTDKKLDFNTKYYYKVRAYRLDEETKIYGKYSELITKKTALTKTTITVSTNRYRNVVIEWTKVKGARRYYVFRCNENGENCEKIGYGHGTEYVNKTAKEGVKYIYKVKPYKDGVYGPYSNAEEGLRLDDTISYTVKNTAYQTNKISIDNVETATKYYIFRATSKYGTYKKIKTLDSTGSTIVYEDKDLEFNKTYYYKIKVNNGVNNSDYSSVKYVTTNTLAKPSFIIETENAYATININKVEGATGYQIVYSTDGETFETLVKTKELTYDKKYNDGTYQIKVRAYRKVGSTYYYSKYSKTQELTISSGK